jgi:hypothetical protein
MVPLAQRADDRQGQEVVTDFEDRASEPKRFVINGDVPDQYQLRSWGIAAIFLENGRETEKRVCDHQQRVNV